MDFYIITTTTNSDLPPTILTESSINPVKQSANKPSLPLPNTDLPDHLITMFALIDWNGVDVDSLHITIPTWITGQHQSLAIRVINHPQIKQGGR